MAGLYKFPGGLQLESFKSLTSERELRNVVVPTRLVFPLNQHVGTPSVPVVQIGDRVKKGQLIAKAGSYVGDNIHASSSGVITDIGQYCCQENGNESACIVLETDGEEAWTDLMPELDFRKTSAEDLEERITQAGIIGLGGAGFPSHVKVIEAADEQIETLIINGVECEPYISCDDRLLRDRAEEVISGAEILKKITSAKRIIIAVEDDMPEAYESLLIGLKTCESKIELVKVPAVYPAGGERQLIRTLTSKWVPAHGLPIHTGVLVQNVATVAAIYRAVSFGEPLISRIVTVVGSEKLSQNIEVLNGTRVCDLLSLFQRQPQDDQVIRCGGGMMGRLVKSDQVPITKKTNCILLQQENEEQPESSCIRCGDCVDVCPELLQPQMLISLVKSGDYETLKDNRLFNCIECRCCDVVCPSHIPLVANFKQAKLEINERKTASRRAEKSRERYLARVARLDRLAREKKESKLNKVKPDLKKEKLQDEVLAAIQRAKSKRKKNQTK